MPKRSSKQADINQIAARIVKAATEPRQTASVKKILKKKKNPAAVALGRLGGKKGGKARAEKLSPQDRKAIALKAARARWGAPPTH